MARVRLLDKDQALPQAREVFARTEGNGARIINLYRALAHSPTVMLNTLRLGNSLLRNASLPARLREIAILRIADLCGSQYEWRQHQAIAMGAGVSPEQISAIPSWRDSAAFNDLERAVLQYTDELTRDARVGDETFRHLMLHLDEQKIVELTVSVGYWALIARVLVGLQVDLEPAVGSINELKGKS